MPRARDRTDRSDDSALAAPSPRRREGEGGGKLSSSSSSNNNIRDLSTDYTASHSQALQPAPTEDPQLIELENRLNDEVDEDFFEDPRKFNTLPRVIDVLGIQMIDDATVQQESAAGLKKNPAYKQLQAQHQVVEDAIEHLAVIHAKDLNASVIKVGRVARQLSQAVSKVRGLRKQVKDIQDSLGTQSAGTNSQSLRSKNKNGTTTTTTATALSLRELWLKKLECEATLALLSQLDVLRAAPAQFDQHVAQGRIGAGVLQISTALQTMFQDNVAQVQALHKIMEQLMIRKQKAEEMIWESLKNVVYLRTGNAVYMSKSRQATKVIGPGSSVAGASAGPISGGHSVSSDSRLTANSSIPMGGRQAAAAAAASMAIRHNGMVNPFINSKHVRSDDDLPNNDNDSVASSGSQASLFSLEDGEAEELSKNAGASSNASESGEVSSLARKSVRRLLIPIPMMEAELDLESDERRCQEDLLLQGLPRLYARQLPRFADPVVALRILVESLYQLKRLDDVERVVQENLEAEIRFLVQRQQSATFALLENTGNITDADFRRHLTGLLSALGSVLIRLTHLAQIVRFRISSDRELLRTTENPSSVLRGVLNEGYDLVHAEIKDFLKACLSPPDNSADHVMDTAAPVGTTAGFESGLFSMGIIDEEASDEPARATRTNVVEMPTSQFVSSVLFARSKSRPHARYALTFRRMIARFTLEADNLKRELAMLTGEDTSTPSYRSCEEEPSIDFLDEVIQKQLLPKLQEAAVNDTVRGLERRDAFDPVLDRSVYVRPNSNEPQDVEMCLASQSLYRSTGPLFLALHRLPRGGEMYLPLVAVLEHVMLTFISRVKQQMAKICENKTAYALLMGEEIDGTDLARVMERRKPYTSLIQAYADGDLLDPAPSDDGTKSGIAPIAPPHTDTTPRQSTNKADDLATEIAEGLDGEEIAMQKEMEFMKKYFAFEDTNTISKIVVCSDEDLMKASTLAHALLKVARLLEGRLKIRTSSGFNRTLTSTRALREAIKTVTLSGVKMAKFCRLDMLMQVVTRLSKVCLSSTLVARDAVRIPSSVNDLGEYLTGASDNLREAAGNAVTAYTFSSLEQYIPLCLMQTVRVIAQGNGVIKKSPLTMNGIEALDRSGSVLYRDLKGATSFDNSFWDVELAALSFERSASFMAMMELEMEELVAYYSANRGDFSEEDFILMFSMTGPRRQGDVGRFHMMKRRMKKK